MSNDPLARRLLPTLGVALLLATVAPAADQEPNRQAVLGKLGQDLAAVHSNRARQSEWLARVAALTPARGQLYQIRIDSRRRALPDGTELEQLIRLKGAIYGEDALAVLEALKTAFANEAAFGPPTRVELPRVTRVIETPTLPAGVAFELACHMPPVPWPW